MMYNQNVAAVLLLNLYLFILVIHLLFSGIIEKARESTR